MDHGSSSFSALEWGIKHSLVQYVLGMSDGSAVTTGDAAEVGGEFRFPAAEGPASAESDDLRFAGGVTISGHGGMLKLVIEDPQLLRPADPAGAWTLTIADPYEPGARLAFATVEHLDLTTGTTRGTRLTADGADLFFSGPYTEGTELDDPRVVLRG